MGMGLTVLFSEFPNLDFKNLDRVLSFSVSRNRTVSLRGPFKPFLLQREESRHQRLRKSLNSAVYPTRSIDSCFRTLGQA